MISDKELQRIREKVELSKEFKGKTIQLMVNEADSIFSTIEELKGEVNFWKQAAETQKDNNLAILNNYAGLRSEVERYRTGAENIVNYTRLYGESAEDALQSCKIIARDMLGDSHDRPVNNSISFS